MTFNFVSYLHSLKPTGVKILSCQSKPLSLPFISSRHFPPKHPTKALKQYAFGSEDPADDYFDSIANASIGLSLRLTSFDFSQRDFESKSGLIVVVFVFVLVHWVSIFTFRAIPLHATVATRSSRPNVCRCETQTYGEGSAVLPAKIEAGEDGIETWCGSGESESREQEHEVCREWEEIFGKRWNRAWKVLKLG